MFDNEITRNERKERLNDIKDEIKEFLKNKSFDDLKDIKSEIELQMRNKNPENMRKIHRYIFNEVCGGKLYSGSLLNLKDILVYIYKHFGFMDNIKKDDMLNEFESKLKSHLKELTLTDINNIPSNSSFKVTLKEDSILNNIYKITHSHRGNLDNHTILSLIIGYLSGDINSYIKDKFTVERGKDEYNKYLIESKKKDFEFYKNVFPEFFNKDYRIEDLLNENIEFTIIDTKNNITNKIFINNSFLFIHVDINESIKKLKTIKEIKIESKHSEKSLDDISFGF